jgi:hypothetical protein
MLLLFRCDDPRTQARHRRRVRLSCCTLFAACLALTACTSTTEYDLGQPVAMGPWTFRIERASEKIERRAGDSRKTVSVVLRLDNYRERHDTTFDDFLNGHSTSSMFSNPHFQLVDDKGAQFSGWLIPVSGGSLRSEEWRAEFVLVTDDFSVQDASELAAAHLNKQLADLRIVLKNPERRRGQPGRVAVRLR